MRDGNHIRNFLSSSAIKNQDLQVPGDHHQLIRNTNSKRLIIFFTATGAAPKQFNFWKVGNELAAHANMSYAEETV